MSKLTPQSASLLIEALGHEEFFQRLNAGKFDAPIEQPEPVQPTRVKFALHASSLMLCGEGWIQPRQINHFKEATALKLDRATLFEATEHGIENESFTDEDLKFWLDNFLIYEHDGQLFASVLEDEFQVLE
jgi:hypothetical protein